jgi:hypothetical protein
LNLPYAYNTIDLNQTLFFQQQSNFSVSSSLAFSLPSSANFYAEVGFEFLVTYPNSRASERKIEWRERKSESESDRVRNSNNLLI